MYAPLDSSYEHDRTPAPDIKFRISLVTHDGRRALNAFGVGCLGLELVKINERRVVAVLKPGEALRLKR